jgi:hypothetical protein
VACNTLVPHGNGIELSNRRGESYLVCPSCATGFFICADCGEVRNTRNRVNDRDICYLCLNEENERETLSGAWVHTGALASERMARSDEPGWICNDCGNEFGMDVDSTDVCGFNICEDCFADNYTTCDRCGDVCVNDDSTLVHTDGHSNNSETWCSECVDSHSRVCDRCGETFVTGAIISDDNTCVCEECFQNHYGTCTSCDGIFLHDSLYWSERTEEEYCEHCFPDTDEDDNNDGTGHPRWLREYSHTHGSRFFFDGENDPDVDKDARAGNGPADVYRNIHLFRYPLGRTLHFGTEIEFDCRESGDGDWDPVESLINNNSLFVEIAGDGSLDYGAEIKSQPATLAAHYAFDWPRFMETLIAAGWRAHDVSHPGLHIHLSRDAFDGEAHIAKFVLLFHRLWDQLARFSRRRTFGYCRRYDDIHSPGDDTDDVIEKAKYQNDTDRNMCVNLRRDDTVEVRLWKGTLNVTTYYATIEMCHLLFHMSRGTEIDVLHRVSWNDVKERAATYKYLPAYLERRGL